MLQKQQEYLEQQKALEERQAMEKQKEEQERIDQIKNKKKDEESKFMQLLFCNFGLLCQCSKFHRFIWSKKEPSTPPARRPYETKSL